MDVINIISIIVSPIIAVIVGQILQNNSKKRAEKLEIFKTLMAVSYTHLDVYKRQGICIIDGINNNRICITFIHTKQVTRVILFHGVLIPTDNWHHQADQ